MVTYEMLRGNAAVNTYITRADESLSALGFTEHSFPHVCGVADMAENILRTLGYSEHKPLVVPASDALHVQKVIAAAYESTEKNIIINIK